MDTKNRECDNNIGIAVKRNACHIPAQQIQVVLHEGSGYNLGGLGDGSDFSDDGATADSANIGVENKEIASVMEQIVENIIIFIFVFMPMIHSFAFIFIVMEYTPAAWGCVFSPCNGAYRDERGDCSVRNDEQQ